MDQDELVAGDAESRGRQLIKMLDEGNFDVQLAFWAKPADESKWYLYLASPYVGEQGSAAAYQTVNRVLRQSPELRIDPLQVKVLRPDDSPAFEAAAKLRPRIPSSPFAVQNPNPYRGMTVLYDCTLGGYEFDEVLIYPPHQTQISP